MRTYIRWSFLVAFAGFMAVMKKTAMMYHNANLFVILWLIASFVTVFGVIYFKDK